jgi:4-hydroxybenzoate polyprenyltransferase
MYVAYMQDAYHLNWNDYLSVIMLILAYYFSWMFAVALNDYYDQDIDAISNSSRPITQAVVKPEMMKSVAGLFLICGLVAGYLAGYHAFFSLLAFNAFYYFYSAPPLRIKILSIICPFFFGLLSLATVLTGFFTFSTNKSLTAFPIEYILAIVVAFFLVQHVKDIKDVEGDKKAGIITIPTLAGAVWGPRIVGIMAGSAYLVAGYVFQGTLVWIVSIITALLTYWVATRKNYTEWPIFALYYLYSLVLILIYALS